MHVIIRQDARAQAPDVSAHSNVHGAQEILSTLRSPIAAVAVVVALAHAHAQLKTVESIDVGVKDPPPPHCQYYC